MRNVLCVGKHSIHPCLGKCGCSVSFASSGHMKHALRVQNIISVTTVTMSRQMPFVMFLFVCTVYLLTPVNLSQDSIQMILFLPLDSSGSQCCFKLFHCLLRICHGFSKALSNICFCSHLYMAFLGCFCLFLGLYTVILLNKMFIK